MKWQRAASRGTCPSSTISRTYGGASYGRFGALGIGVGVGFFLAVHYDLISLLASPIAPYLKDHKLVYTHPVDTFSITSPIAMVIGG